MTECRTYEKEKTKHKMSTNLYEIIGQLDLTASLKLLPHS